RASGARACPASAPCTLLGDALPGALRCGAGVALDAPDILPGAVADPADALLGARLVGRTIRGLGALPDEAPPALTRVAEEARGALRSEEHTSELQSRENLVCRLLLEKKKKKKHEKQYNRR